MVPGPIGETPEAIVRIARPIHGDQELDQLAELVGGARLVLIGNASHGSRELHDLRGSLTRKLISQHGFAAVAIDGDWPDALRVDRYARQHGDDESAGDALAAFERFPTWMWRNSDVAAFLYWLHAWNSQRDAGQRAGFYGLDLYALHASIRAVLSFFDEADPDAARVARARYGCFDHVGGDAECPGCLDHAGGDPARPGTQPRFGFAASCEADVVTQLIEMQRRHAARSGRTPNGDGWFHTMQDAHVIKDAEAYYRAMLGGRRTSWNLRDMHMADTLDLLADHLAGKGRLARLVVWAHNAHVGDARATAMGARGELTLGQVMRERHPGEVALIGMTTHTGSVRCARGWDEPAVLERVRPSLPGSWEELFHDAGSPRFYLTATALKRVVGERTERLHRAIGLVYRPESERHSHYYRARLGDQFDLVIHVDTTHAVTPLAATAPVPPPTDADDLSQTLPPGL
jgi:erythromycin esterase-like protein